MGADNFGGNPTSGATYICTKGATGWPTTPNTTLGDPSADPNDSFGYAVAISGATAIVGSYGANAGAGAAYVYAKGATGWPTTPSTTLGDPAAEDFGTSAAISGSTAIVGAWFTNSYAGAAHLFQA